MKMFRKKVKMAAPYALERSLEFFDVSFVSCSSSRGVFPSNFVQVSLTLCKLWAMTVNFGKMF